MMAARCIPIPNRPHTLNNLWFRGIQLDLFPQQENVLIERAGVREIIEAPAGIEEDVAGDGFAAAIVEEAEHGNLAWGELDGFSVSLGDEGAGADG